MNKALLSKKFEEIGAQVKFESTLGDRAVLPITVDVKKNRKGKEQFFINTPRDGSEVDLTILDSNPESRHLLLMLKSGKDKVKYLCGHDERQWYVAGVPGNAKGNVFDAIETLKPPLVISSQTKSKVKTKDLRSPSRSKYRKNEAYIRQGGWFFVPCSINPIKNLILQNEPISRGRLSKPHICENLYRCGGTTVYVHRTLTPHGITEKEYKDLIRNNPKIKKSEFRVMKRDALVYVKGKVRHPDHTTIVLPNWHQVFINRESESKARESIVFLD